MEGNESAAEFTVRSSIEALGRGFDVNNDTRLLYCKGVAGPRVIEVDEEHTNDLRVYSDVIVSNVPRCVWALPESVNRESTGVLSFNQMAEYFNRKARLSGNVPLGSFNSAFSFTGSKEADALATKHLAMDGMTIPLCRVDLMGFFSLRGDVKHAIPSSWEPSSLARFIENYGTHIVTSVTIGGKDIIYVKQQRSSPLSIMDIKSYIQDIGNRRFSDTESHTISGPLNSNDKGVNPNDFNSQGVHPQLYGATNLGGKEDLTVIFRRRGGNDLVQSHSQWKQTVREAPDVINMAFVPITSLLDGIPGKDHLTRAISLYLEYKPPMEELRYFLEFQIPRIWAPIRGEIPGHQRKDPLCPFLQFSMMGPKLYVSQEQVSVGRKPVTGMRLALEGQKQNRLCVHIQHLVTLPKILQPYWDTHIPIGAPKWHGPEEQDSRWFEPVKWKNFSHVSTSPIENHGAVIVDLSGVHIVTGAQLGVWDFGTKSVLYMRLLYSCLPGCSIRRSFWDHNLTIADDDSRSSTGSEPPNSGESSSTSKEAGGAKLLKRVDMSEVSKGPQNSPGHWLVTGGKLGVEKGRIFLRLKYSLLNY